MHSNAHDKPPAYLRAVFKKYQKITIADLTHNESILDLKQLHRTRLMKDLKTLDWKKQSEVLQAFKHFISPATQQLTGIHISSGHSREHILAYELDDLPGLYIIPSLLSLDVQETILSKLFHRDLQSRTHKTNVHLHHNVSYPAEGQSFFNLDPSIDDMILPKDVNVHKPMTIGQFMGRKLRWMTLGGQYDWTAKVYPNEQPPEFPGDLSDLLHGLFPQTKPEAAIVNLYSPGDTLSLHRDVSEDCDKGLISLSIGCDALFVIGFDATDGQEIGRHIVMRIRSGDVLYMTESARYAWHGVPMVVPDTSPDELQNWPDQADGHSQQPGEGTYRPWRGWMGSKRINLNVRQMHN